MRVRCRRLRQALGTAVVLRNARRDRSSACCSRRCSTSLPAGCRRSCRRFMSGGRSLPSTLRRNRRRQNDARSRGHRAGRTRSLRRRPELPCGTDTAGRCRTLRRRRLDRGVVGAVARKVVATLRRSGARRPHHRGADGEHRFARGHCQSAQGARRPQRDPRAASAVDDARRFGELFAEQRQRRRDRADYRHDRFRHDRQRHHRYRWEWQRHHGHRHNRRFGRRLNVQWRIVSGPYYAASLDVSYELDLYGRVKRDIEASRADLAAQAARRDTVRTSVAAEVARAYADACSAASQLGVAQQSLQLQAQTYDLTERLAQAGRDTPLDTSRARAQYEQVRATIAPFAAQRRDALYRLSVLTGHAPEEVSPAAAACTTPPALKRPVPVGDGTALIKRRPDVRQADRQLAAASARVGVAIASLYPKISLGGTVGTSGISSASSAAIQASTSTSGRCSASPFPTSPLLALASVRRKRRTRRRSRPSTAPC